MQIHSDYMVAPSDTEHVGDQLGRDGCSALFLFVLSRVWITWDHSGDSTRRRGLACRNKDEELHEVVVDVAAAGLNDEHVGVADRLCDFDVDLAVGELADNGRRQSNA
jgi:hypothetical protein